jgi:hypothetical protein
MAKGFHLHKANRIWVLNNPFSKSEKSFYKIVFEIYSFQTILWQRKLCKSLCKISFASKLAEKSLRKK